MKKKQKIIEKIPTLTKTIINKQKTKNKTKPTTKLLNNKTKQTTQNKTNKSKQPIKNKSTKKNTITNNPNQKLIIQTTQKRKNNPKNLKEALEKKLTKQEFEHAPKAFDSFGNIALIEIPKELNHKKKIICDTLLEIQPRFETICSIESNHEGKYRIQKIKIISGKKQTIATYKESNCTFKIPLEKAFFSPRLSNERLRIAKEIKKNEVIGCWFSGIGPYPIVFAKNSEMKQAIAIELNPIAHDFAKQNYVLNRLEKNDSNNAQKIVFVKGDVKKLYKNYPKFFDKIAMPLPHTGYQFLEEAFYFIKPRGIIYFYEIIEKNNFSLPLQQIKDSAKKNKRSIKIIRQKKVRQFSPTKEQVVFDIQLTN